ncbi:MAG: radical SAM protein, partial [Candidatus Omnitrophica bacterium]|nr:radical SAM protein [Candidatus Omnitrophota bacterium]
MRQLTRELMPIPLQSGVIYGPIESRRFGKSLGVNFLPTDRKVCNFNCVYCQYGFSEPSPQADWPTVDEIYEASEDFFQRAKEDNASFDWVMIAGNGEPTLYPDFLAAVDRLLGLRDEFFPRLPVGILSNASTCHRPAGREGLRKLDGCFMKLDAGDSRIFKRLNQPVGNTSLAFMLEGLRGLEKITLQSLFVMGKVDNTAPAAVEA